MILKIRHTKFTAATTFCFAALFLGCTKSEAPFDHTDKTESKIHITTSIASSPESKAPAVDNGATKYTMSDIGFMRKDDVSVPDGFQDITAIMGSRDASGKITFSPTVPNYNKNNENAYFTAYWPANGATVQDYGVEWTIDGKTDILYAPVWNAGNYLNPISSGMTFEHQLSQLEVVLKTGATASHADVQTAWGKVSKIELVGTSATVLYNYSSISYEQSADIALLNTDYETEFPVTDIPASDNTAVCAAGMFAPTTDILTLRLTFSPRGTANIASTTIQVLLEEGFVRGKRHKLTLEFEAVQTLLVIYSELTDWRTAYRHPSEIKDPSLEILKPSDGFLDWSFSGIIKSGSFTGLAGITSITGSTTGSYSRFDNTSSGGKNGGYRSNIIAVLAELPYHRLEIAKEYEPVPAGNWDWSAAWKACKDKDTNGGGWRLPRISELMWMNLNGVELQKTTDFAAFAPGSLLSATEGSADECWYMGFPGIIAPVRGTKSAALNAYSVRCVREL